MGATLLVQRTPIDLATCAGLLDVVSEGVVIFRKDRLIQFANKAFMTITGYEVEDMGRSLCAIMHGPQTDPAAIAAINEALDAEASFVGEILNYRKSGEPFWNNLRIEPQFDPSGAFRHFVGHFQDITLRKASEVKASKLERDYRFIFDHVQCAITVHGPDARIRVANPLAVEMLGIDLDDLTGKMPDDHQFELFREDGSPMPLAEYPVLRALADRVPVLGRVLGYQRARDNKRLSLLCSAFPTLDEFGNTAEVVLSFTDITRLVESEAESFAFRERFELAANATQDVIFEWDVKTGAFWANEAFKEVYKYDPPTAIQLDGPDLPSAVEADRNRIRQVTLEAIRSGAERYAVDYDIRRPDGTTGHVAVRAFIVRDAEGEAQRIIGTGTDVGQLTRANAALEQSETRFRLIADRASDVLWDHDLEGPHTWSSPDWPSKLGLDVPPSSAQEFGWLEVVEEADQKKVLGSFSDAIKSGGDVWEIEFKARQATGQIIDVQVKASILRHPDGRAYRILGNMKNVTEERRNQDGYSRARALEAVGQLTGGIAHDFNNFLMIILGNAELLELRELSSEDAETVAMISQAAESAATLTRRLLTFARQNQFNPTRVEVASLIEDTLILLRSGLPESVRLSLHVVDAVRPADIDANGLEQALVNLAMNANDAMPRGGEIVVTCANLDVSEDMIPSIADLAPGSYVAISVSDSGEGMTREVLSKAFEPFFTTKDVGRGTGLGLSTVYGFAKQAGGGVTIYSEVGHGTTVTLYLPAFLCAEESQAPPAPPVSQKTADTLKKVLIVEDQPQVRAHVARTLGMLGYIVVTAPDAVTALAKIKQGETYDLLFIDIIMPGGMNGQELGEAVAELVPDMKILYSSGYPADAFTHLGLKEQSNLELLRKPYKSSELMEAVARLLGAETQPPPERYRADQFDAAGT